MTSEGDCEIHTNCTSCEIIKEGKLSFDLTTSSSFVSGYIVNVTSTSSIPNEISSYQTTVWPQDNFIFLGKDPTQIYFNMIPSVIFTQYYKELTTGITESGYHVSWGQESVLGSQYRTYE